MHEAISHNNRYLTVNGKYKIPRRPNPHAFVAVPEKVVEGIGLYTHMGIRIDSAILATFLYYAQRYRNAGNMKMLHGIVEVHEDQFILSVLKASENLWARWFHLPSDNQQFDRFYRRVQKAMGRLRQKGLLTWAGWADDSNKTVRGSVWTFNETPLHEHIGSLPVIEGREVTVMHSAQEEYVLGNGLINVADLVGSAFVNENMHMFTEAEACYSVDTRGLYMDYLGWTNAVSTVGADGSRFVSVGSTRSEDRGKSNPPTFLFWFVLDIDRTDPFQAFEDTRDVLYRLDEMGVPLEEIVVSYTGGKGCHVRIPSGMFDNPVFKSFDEARNVITEMFAWILDDIEVDPKVFDPRQLIRIVGSKRETGADYSIYTRAFSGEDFLQMSFQGLVTESMEYVPVQLPDPRKSDAVAELVVALVGANDTTRRARFPTYDRKNEWKEGGFGGSIAESALKGIEEGEEWHPSRNGRSFVGRNYGMFIASCHLLRQADGDRDAALSMLLEVNVNNSPPLPRRELESCLKQAYRRLNRDGQV